MEKSSGGVNTLAYLGPITSTYTADWVTIQYSTFWCNGYSGRLHNTTSTLSPLTPSSATKSDPTSSTPRSTSSSIAFLSQSLSPVRDPPLGRRTGAALAGRYLLRSHPSRSATCDRGCARRVFRTDDRLVSALLDLGSAGVG